MTRFAFLGVLLASSLAGCAGHVADYVGPRDGIVAPEVGRFGLDLRQTQCVSNQLTQTLTPRQLRYLNRTLRDVRRGFYDPDRLTVRDLIRSASGMADSAIGLAMVRATAGCDASPEAIAARETARFMAAMPPPTVRPPAWLSLGSAPSGQAIAIDGATLEQQGDVAHRLVPPDRSGARPGQSQHLSAANRLRGTDDQLACPAAAGSRRPHLGVPRISGQPAADRRRHGDGDRLPVALPGRDGGDPAANCSDPAAADLEPAATGRHAGPLTGLACRCAARC